MFINEKELVEKLVTDLQERFETKYIVKELRGGNNIADIVYVTNINRNNIMFDEYFNAYYYFNSIYNNKKTNLDNIMISNKQVNKKFHHFLKELEDLGYVEIKDNYVTSRKKIDAVSKDFVAIEAKISDWKAGLEQAIRYKQYANKVYVALSSEYIPKVDKQKFKDLNIGLMSVSTGKLRIPIKAKKEPVTNLDIQYYIADRFLKQLKLSDILQ